MLKILTSEPVKQADAYTITNEPVSAENLMERASSKATEWLLHNFSSSENFVVVCGPGNNGGDGFVISRMLIEAGKKVTVYATELPDKSTAEYSINLDRLKKLVDVTTINESASVSFVKADVIIDALLGNGLSRSVSGVIENLIKTINDSKAVVVSIDVPTGMFTNQNTTGSMVRADFTLTFQYPKLAFLFPEPGINAGNVEVIDIGLIDKEASSKYIIESSDIKSIYRKRKNFSHKGTFGHALIIAGSKGKTGAAVLSVNACIRSGAGMVTAAIPSCSENAINHSVPEAMTFTSGDLYISSFPDLKPYNAIACGPGLGTHEDSANALKRLIQDFRSPLVLDADALNILSENKTWLSFLFPGTILTPHPGEFARLVGKWSDNFERHQMQIDFSKKYNCYVVLKDHYTCISTPDGSCYFNNTGNPGMATAGSGDVLTGIITALLAQYYPPIQSAIMGVYLHGLAGDFAAANNSMEALTATSIIQNIGKAFLSIQEMSSGNN